MIFEGMTRNLAARLIPLLAATRNDPQAYLEHACNAPPLRKWQASACRQIKEHLDAGERRIRVLIRSCHGAGKTFLAAGLLKWWMDTRLEARGVTTAPTWVGVEKLLWPEIRRLHRESLLGSLGMGKCLTTELRYRPEWFAIGLSSDHPANLEGHHSRTAAIRVIDEAKAVPGSIYDATEGLLDAPETLDVWISTPSTAYGRFYERDITLRRPDDGIIRIVVTIDDIVDEVPGKREWKEERLVAWGVESDEYRSRALAEYLTGSERSLFPPAWIEAAMGKAFDMGELLPIAGLDVAGSIDGDENAACKARGFDRDGRAQVVDFDAWLEASTMKTRDRALRFVNAEAPQGQRPLVIDTVGIGKGVYDSLAERSYEVVSYVAQTQANDPTRYYNLKTELAFLGRDLLEAGKLALPPKSNPQAERFLTQAAGMTFVITPKGQKKIVDPEDSPDLVDSFLAALYGLRMGLGRGQISTAKTIIPPRPAAGIRRAKLDAA